jgi:methylated-DNA-[protein]-cysteine S-methyltransferase
MTYFYKTKKSPVGELKLVASDKGLAAILWEKDNPRRVPLASVVEDKDHPVLLETERQLNDYFAGKRKSFSLALDFKGTEFQKAVAVGAANGKNPISIIAPCHRVIGSTGKLTGFAGGLKAKATLLALEEGKGLWQTEKAK